MRANVFFILGLVTLSCVACTSFTATLSNNAELKSVVEGIKAKKNMGSIIMTMAEMSTSDKRFTALYVAIDKLSAFLVKDRAQENKSFREATAQFNSDVARLTKARDVAKGLYEADIALLKNKLYPERRRLAKLIKSLESQLEGLQNDLATLRADRVKEIAVFQARSKDYSEGIAACKKALPILQGLVNGQSFAELNEDLFAQISQDLKSTLGRLEFGSLHVVFVESLVQTLKMQNFVDQAGLSKVINLIENLQKRLESGLVALNADEAANLKAFEAAQAQLVKSIAHTQEQLKLNRARQVANEKKIEATEKHRDEQIAIYKQRVEDLRIVNKNYKQRTADHKQFIAEVNSQEATIAEAVEVLNKAGVTRDA